MENSERDGAVQRKSSERGKKGFCGSFGPQLVGGYESRQMGAVCLSIAACVLFWMLSPAHLKYAYPGGAFSLAQSIEILNPYLGHRLAEIPCLGREGSFFHWGSHSQKQNQS